MTAFFLRPPLAFSLVCFFTLHHICISYELEGAQILMDVSMCNVQCPVSNGWAVWIQTLYCMYFVDNKQ